jgi:phosphoglycerate dehydrogenase-like enzyme
MTTPLAASANPPHTGPEPVSVSALPLPPTAPEAETLRRAEALISWRLGRELPPGELAEARRLRLVQLLSAGVDNIDFTAIPEGVLIADNGGSYARPMAEHVMAMTLSLAKRLPQRHAALARGEFDQETPSLTLEGAGCAILGFGGIGKRTAALMRAFGARIYAVNTSGQTTEPVEFVGTLADLGRVLAVADVLVISLPLTRATRGIIGERELARMKPSAILVNVARAGIIVEGALYDHLRAYPNFSAGIDTWWHEPPLGEDFRTDYPFFDLPNVLARRTTRRSSRDRIRSPRGTPPPTCGGTSRAAPWPGRSGGRIISQADGLVAPPRRDTI